ncbi:hypothetical protein GOEFS_132_00180 [Gordonia effusa NBRC 100432]|uniref:SnoaL-like domain-containing protein n=1 Tax=Gordonia effusa NBRC 100432 TaxID=1077974 RepID=H0R6T6_9ACTN|nr:nuclear transport factor 2 family protein [Gordonia effusa]GAB20787.1 hypothetical protein GOEFS_132_00180 [Gordonia effusa NBRC 100432]
MTTSTTLRPSTTADLPDRFVSAVTTRDFAALGSILKADIRFRALVPPGPFELTGAPAVVAQFEQWFGGGRRFDVLGHSTGMVGTRVHAHWTVRRTPDSPDAAPLTAEQHAYLTVDDAITSIDLVCSGWQETVA